LSQAVPERDGQISATLGGMLVGVIVASALITALRIRRPR
jgi:hypothetical protein